MEDFLVFRDASGEVITLLDGRVTLGQVIVLIVGIIAVGVALKVLKGIIRFVVTIAAILACVFYLGIATPDDLIDAANKAKEYGTQTLESYSDSLPSIPNFGHDSE